MVDSGGGGGGGDGEKFSNEIERNEKPMDFDNLKDQKAIKSWLDWCRTHPSVLCVEYPVPQGILPKGYHGILIDVKVGVAKKRTPDDHIYLAHPELRAKVARGNCVLELYKLEKGQRSPSTKTYLFLIFALKKFSGGLGDEDDSDCPQSKWSTYFIKNIETTTKVIATEKANGEAAHLSSTKLFNQTYFCIGSKNVHMLVRHLSDVSKYTEQRFGFARTISQTFFQSYLDNPEISQDKKHSFLTHLQTTNLTLVAEIIQPDNQHVVNLSHLIKPEIRFICWTKPDFFSEDAFIENDQTDSLCPLPINLAIDQARNYGLNTVDYEVIEILENVTLEMEHYMNKIRKGHDYEGKVLYFLNSENCTIGLIKKKTAWYIILRAVREKVASFKKATRSSSSSTFSMTDKIKNVAKRITELNEWLGLPADVIQKWTELSTGFAKWLVLNPEKCINIRSQFPIIFEQFLIASQEGRITYEQLINETN